MNQHFLTECACYVITLECIIFIFLTFETKRSVIFHCFCCRPRSYRCFAGQFISRFCWRCGPQHCWLGSTHISWTTWAISL